MWTIIRKEALENFLTLRFAIGFAACLLVFGLVTYVLMQDFRLEWEQVKAAEHDSEQEIQGWEVYSQVRPTIIKEPSLLAVFGSDFGRQWGKRVYTSHTRIPVFTSDETASGTTADFLGFFYSFDFITVVQIFISLLALLFSFDLISGEKQQATLKLVLSNPVQRTRLFAGKYLGALLALLPVIAASFLVVFLIYVYSMPAPPGVEDWIGLSLILFATFLYGAVFTAVGMLISSLTQRTASSLIGCMIIWVFLVLVAPNAVGFFSSELGFNEDAREFDQKLSDLYGEYDEAFEALGYQPQDYIVTMNSSSFGEGAQIYRIMGKNAEKFLMGRLPGAIEGQNEFAVKRYGLESEYYAKRMAKMTLMNNLMRISPSSLFANTVDALAGTDAAAHEVFIRRARAYRDEVMAYIGGNGGYTNRRWFTNDVYDMPFREIVETAETMTLAEMGQYFGEILQSASMRELIAQLEEIINDPSRRLNLSDMPRFEQERVELSAGLVSAAFDLLLMIIFITVAMSLCYVKFLSYDPR